MCKKLCLIRYGYINKVLGRFECEKIIKAPDICYVYEEIGRICFDKMSNDYISSFDYIDFEFLNLED